MLKAFFVSGHSKWSNIRLKKGAEDKKRAAIFTKAARLITSAVKEGGSFDPNANPSLRAAIEKARAVNMPKDNINRAVSRGEAYLGRGGVGDSSGFAEIQYEGYGPYGVALVLKVVTDNKNRAAAELKNLLGRFGGSLGEPGSAAYAFSNGLPTFKIPVPDKDKFAEFIEELEEMEDLVSVVHNADI